MFPRLRQQLLARADLLVELATLGEYGLDEDGRVMTLDCEPAPARPAPRVRDRCSRDATKASGRGAPAPL